MVVSNLDMTMLNRKTHYFVLLVLILSTQLFAQAGPELPCFDCEQLTRKVVPTTGFWYNPEQSGSGLSIEVKKSTVFGAYYGYNDEGKPIWFTFLGQLKSSNKTGVMWELDSDLLEFKDGNSLNNNYQAPTLLESEHQIHIEFNHMNHANFSVDNGSIQNIVPLAYGVEHQAYFPELTTLQLPNLQGFWVLSFRVNTDIHPEVQSFIAGYHSPFMVYLTDGHLQQFDDGTSNLTFIVNELQPVPELGLVIGGVGCYTTLDENNNVQGPICSLTAFVDDFRDYKMTMGGMGIDKLFGETEDGYTFKAFRYDYCDFNLNDIGYVCEYDYSAKNNLEQASKKVSSKSKKLKMSQKPENLTEQGKTKGQAYEAFKALKFNLSQDIN